MDREEAQRELMLRAARSYGVGTLGDLATYYEIPAKNARARVAELVEQGALRRQPVAWLGIGHAVTRLRPCRFEWKSAWSAAS